MKGPTLDKSFDDAVHQIIQGRQPYSSLKDAVATWRKNGGDTIRSEYQT